MDKITIYSDLRYFVDYDYHTENDCENSGCYNDMCRCGRIVDVRVERISPSLQLATHLVGKDDTILLYAVDRLLTHMPELRNTHSYDVSIDPGYYGEEMGSIKLEHAVARKVDTVIEFLKQASNTERIEYVLTLENGMVLPKLKGLNWSVKRVDLASIAFPNEDRKESLSQGAMNYYSSCVPCRADIPQALVLEAAGKYGVVDGYHRITAALKGKKEPKGNVLVLVGEHA